MLPGGPPNDPVDRIIAATGRVFGYTVVTRDGDLMRYARAGHNIQAIGC
jgi:PIN domain nuclease of toxin-antitoxin system